MPKKQTDEPVRSAWREIGGTVLMTVGLLILLGIASYKPSQIALFQSNPDWRSNWIGLFGAKMAFLALMYFGIAGYVIPIGIIGIGISAVARSYRKIYPRFLWFLLFLVCLSGLVGMNEAFWSRTAEGLNIGGIPGGLIGDMIARRTLGSWIGFAGAGIVCMVTLFISVLRLFNLHIVDALKHLWKWIRELKLEQPSADEVFEKPEPKPKPRRKRTRRVVEPDPVVTQEPEIIPDVDIRQMVAAQQEQKRQEEPVTPPVEEPVKKPVRKKVAAKESSDTNEAESFAKVDDGGHDNYKLPSLDMLDPPVPQGKGMSADEIASTAEVLQNALEEFGVEAKVTGVQQGPVVTCYEILPASGVRVERIKNLADNLALKMHAESIRIQAPIPGKGVCGVEIPNTTRASVFFREMIQSREFQSGRHALPLVLGKDVNGKSIMYDLAKMPHLLIAGATGAGKSVCMNSILTGLLMKHSPDDLRMILVDPKTVEFHAYNNLPHLVVPVITNAKKVALGLKWAIDEMERRFKWFNQAGVRDLPSFNARVIQKQTELFGDEMADEAPERKKKELPDKLPYIVIVIDELADLMHVAQAEIEAGIARLAAKSRAAGIHMILATQRPDVKVITGTIKANFPVRIAFKVSQKVDSRTILDRMGADTLLGKGDMLVLPPGTDKLIRLQGVYTSDDEINRITSYCKEQSQPEFIQEIHEKIDKPTTDLPEMDNGGDDEIVEQAMEVIRQTKRASTSSLQRRLRIGYTRAARVMDLLEERGIVGPPDGAGPREILIDLDGEIPQNTGAVESGDDKEA
ncbi:MAG: DNA translocase FtsK 4TM domain-containing protein [Pontiellaceae bacterium]|nr:DNA translocase FtsK 4TM domain-containing protein [Pontiellaceae bacterium]MBN2784768.1 DNA translocase FtsK 4TM domain-containing protein [Pontiellaceae bacterium]